MRLEGEGARGQLARVIARLRTERFGIFQQYLTVDFHHDLSALDNNFLGPPLIILRRGLRNVDHVIKAAGLLPIGVGVINLALKPELWKALFLVLRVEINASI